MTDGEWIVMIVLTALMAAGFHLGLGWPIVVAIVVALILARIGVVVLVFVLDGEGPW